MRKWCKNWSQGVPTELLEVLEQVAHFIVLVIRFRTQSVLVIVCCFVPSRYRFLDHFEIHMLAAISIDVAKASSFSHIVKKQVFTFGIRCLAFRHSRLALQFLSFRHYFLHDFTNHISRIHTDRAKTKLTWQMSSSCSVLEMFAVVLHHKKH